MTGKGADEKKEEMNKWNLRIRKRNEEITCKGEEGGKSERKKRIEAAW